MAKASSPTGVTLLLPWLDSDLSPNARPHHMAKARKIRDYKMAAALVASDAHRQLGRTLKPPVKAQWIFVPPNKRKRDIDNMTSNYGCKAAVDACVLEGLLEDDNSKVLTWGEPLIQEFHHLLDGGPGILLLLDEVEP